MSCAFDDGLFLLALPLCIPPLHHGGCLAFICLNAVLFACFLFEIGCLFGFLSLHASLTRQT
jgi:hypothetical protein